MTKEEIEAVDKDKEGLQTYEFLVNHLYELNDAQLSEVIDHLESADRSGQYLASGARYMHAIDSERFKEYVRRLVALTIERDRERNYLSDLIQALYGANYYDRVEELASDDNFRRMYKRLFPDGAL